MQMKTAISKIRFCSNNIKFMCCAAQRNEINQAYPQKQYSLHGNRPFSFVLRIYKMHVSLIFYYLKLRSSRKSFQNCACCKSILYLLISKHVYHYHRQACNNHGSSYLSPMGHSYAYKEVKQTNRQRPNLVISR